MVRPLNQFCCGCSLSFGVKLILALNLIENIFYIATSTSNIILRVPTFGFNSGMATQTFNAAFSLLGLPVILSGFFGVSYRQEPHIRMYLYYILLGFVLDILFVGLFMEDTCTMLPSVLKQHGGAFACGFTRVVTFVTMITVTSIQIYSIFVVWSHCEDLKEGGCGAQLPDLLLGAEEAKRRHRNAGNLGDGLFGTGSSQKGPFPISYGSTATPGVGGSTRIFGGRHHQMDYPPQKV